MYGEKIEQFKLTNRHPFRNKHILTKPFQSLAKILRYADKLSNMQENLTKLMYLIDNFNFSG